MLSQLIFNRRNMWHVKKLRVTLGKFLETTFVAKACAKK
jgi:hypothetical protein